MSISYNDEQGNNSFQEQADAIETQPENANQTTPEGSAVSTDGSVGNQENQIETNAPEGNVSPAVAGAHNGRNQQDKVKQFSEMLRKSKNIILHGAPGTGKTYLAKEIAAYIISNGHCIKYDDLSDEQKQQMAFVQFHPSYDYTDFVEGLRPIDKNGTIVFELQDGIFKKFVDDVRKNNVESHNKNSQNEDSSIEESSIEDSPIEDSPIEDIQESNNEFEEDDSFPKPLKDFYLRVKGGERAFKTSNKHDFTITSFDSKLINISNPNNPKRNKITLKVDDLKKMLDSGKVFTEVQEVGTFFGRKTQSQDDSYYFAVYKEIMNNGTGNNEIAKKNETSARADTKPSEKEYVFIIDEINRGEISKIFGELFFAIDPSYRGEDGFVSTQYANMHEDKNEKFYIPENVYIIGTMNDIDRSVDSFDFAMRRRFRFVELKAGERQEMLDSLEDKALKDEAIKRMNALNMEITNVEGLNDNYHIGPAYFLKLKDLDFNFNLLWTDYLQPLLHDYIQGMPDEDDKMTKFEKAYNNKKSTEDNANGAEND